jgi:antirestriction protein ArdC
LIKIPKNKKEAFIMASVFEIVMERIIELLAKGDIPWHKLWKSPGD